MVQKCFLKPFNAIFGAEKNLRMKIRYLFAFLFIIVMSACEFDAGSIQYDMGNDFINDPTNVFMIDTLAVNTYTTATDSFVTSRNSRFLAGRHINQYNIETYCESYFRFDPISIPTLHATRQYDSICMVLYLDGYNVGDTTQKANFEIYRLTEEIDVDDETYYIYNTTQFACDESPIAQFTIDFDAEHDSVCVRLPDVLGEELFSLADESSETLTDDEKFKEYFKGMVIKPAAENTSLIVRFKAVPDSATAPSMQIYYHDNTVNDNLHFGFYLESDLSYANYKASTYIKNDYEGSDFEGIVAGETKLSSKLTNNISFLQGGSLVQTRIEIPGIKGLHEYGRGSIIKAELIFEPIYGTYNEFVDLPSILSMNLVDDKNRFYDYLYTIGSTDPAYGYLSYNSDFPRQSYFSYDITNYVKTEYEDEGNNLYSLQLRVPVTSKFPNVDQLFIGNRYNTENKIKLRVYFSNFN